MGQSAECNQTESIMKVFVCLSLLSAALCDQSHHQLIKHGNAPSVSHSVHKPHGAVHASVVSQPHAAPQAVHGYGTYEKASAINAAPAALPVNTGYAPAPVYHAAPAYHAPTYAPAPAYHAAPAYKVPVVAALAYHAPAYAAPAYKTPVVSAPLYKAPVIVAPAYKTTVVAAPAYKAPVVAAPAYKTPVIVAPAYKAPAIAAPAYHAPIVHAAPAYGTPVYKEEPAPYAYQYGVSDDYSKSNFNAAETSDANGAVSGSYSVNLPDGRIQNVVYTADHYNGYIADVSYVGEPLCPAAPAPYKAAPYKAAPAPAYAVKPA